MVFQLFTSILASIVAFFGAIVPLNDDVKHWFSDITVGKTLDTVLPADAHPVSAAELKDVRSGNWMSVVRPQTTTMFFGDYYRDAPKKTAEYWGRIRWQCTSRFTAFFGWRIM